MKPLSVALTLVLLVALPAFAEPAAAGEQQKLVQHLQRTSEKFLASVDGLSEAQWNFKPAPDKWSIAQCAEHIAAAETLIRGAVEKGLTTPLPADQPRAELVKDELIATMLVDRSKKFNAPEPLVPTQRFGSAAATIEAFRKERDTTVELARSNADFRAHAVKHPAFGMLDTYGWLLFTSAHSERHTLQIEEVKAHPDFPKN